MTNANDPVTPHLTYNTTSGHADGFMKGLTKREHFAAMAKTPDAILLGLVDAWKGDGGSLPLWNDVMIKQFAKLEAEYKVAAADSLIEALNKPQTNG